MQMIEKFTVTVMAFLMVISSVYGSEYEFETQADVFAIGDINGGYVELVSILQEVKLVDSSLDWSGGNAHLVSLGNLFSEKGEGSEVLNLFRNLERQAIKAGGQMHVVLGDADINVLSRKYLLKKDSRDWLLERPIVIKINDVVYAHGGISDGLVGESIGSLNQAAIKELGALGKSNPDQHDDHSVFSSRNPVRYEGTAVCHPYSESFNTERFLKNADATHLVVGHVSPGGQVKSRMGGLVILLDTGMADGGVPSVLVSAANGDEYVHYLGSEEKAPVIPEWNQLSQRISGLGDQEIETMLTRSELVSVEEIGTGITNPWRIFQLHDGVEHSAVFKYVDTDPGIQSRKYYNSRKGDISDRYIYEVAAYKLDRMLDIQLIPVAVVSIVKGKEGILQDWVTNAINERDRLEEDVPFDGPCRQLEQYRLRIVFDILIYNEDRNLTNIIWAKENFKMRFIDHTRAFRSSKKRPEQYRKVNIRVSDLLKAKLESLNIASLTEELGDYLHPKQIQALLARRDLILRKMVST